MIQLIPRCKKKIRLAFFGQVVFFSLFLSIGHSQDNKEIDLRLSTEELRNFVFNSSRAGIERGTLSDQGELGENGLSVEKKMELDLILQSYPDKVGEILESFISDYYEGIFKIVDCPSVSGFYLYNILNYFLSQAYEIVPKNYFPMLHPYLQGALFVGSIFFGNKKEEEEGNGEYGRKYPGFQKSYDKFEKIATEHQLPWVNLHTERKIKVRNIQSFYYKGWFPDLYSFYHSPHPQEANRIRKGLCSLAFLAEHNVIDLDFLFFKKILNIHFHSLTKEQWSKVFEMGETEIFFRKYSSLLDECFNEIIREQDALVEKEKELALQYFEWRFFIRKVVGYNHALTVAKPFLSEATFSYNLISSLDLRKDVSLLLYKKIFKEGANITLIKEQLHSIKSPQLKLTLYPVLQAFEANSPMEKFLSTEEGGDGRHAGLYKWSYLPAPLKEKLHKFLLLERKKAFGPFWEKNLTNLIFFFWVKGYFAEK